MLTSAAFLTGILAGLAALVVGWLAYFVLDTNGDIRKVTSGGNSAHYTGGNFTGLAETLLDRVPATAHPMPVDAPDLEAAADQYATELPPSLDVVHLGLGDDGHTASLVPLDPTVLIEDRLVSVTNPYRGHRRMTLTRPTLDRAGLIVWIVSGTDKAEMVERLVSRDTSIPAGLISQERAVLVTDSI